MAHSERLNTWVDNRRFRRIRSDVADNIGRARALQKSVAKQLQASLKAELAVGLTQARIAVRSANPKDVSRHTAIARESYDTIIHLSHRMARRDVKSKEFTAELDKLKDALRELGEDI
jgi:ribosomal protein S12 methylthiotransferase accessory factor YcaO